MSRPRRRAGYRPISRRRAPLSPSTRDYKLLRAQSKKALLRLSKRALLTLCDFAGLVLDGEKSMLAERILVSLDR